jgi:hypothetical protein
MLSVFGILMNTICYFEALVTLRDEHIIALSLLTLEKEIHLLLNMNSAESTYFNILYNY